LLSLETTTDDSLRYTIYADLFRLHYRSDLTKAKEYLDEEITAAAKLGDEAIVMRAKNHEGIFYAVKRDNEKALEIFTELKEYYLRVGDKEKVGSLLSNISSANHSLGKFKVALENQMESLNISEEVGEKGVGLAKNYFTIGNIHRSMENYATSQEWIFKALDIYTKEGAKEYKAQADYTIGINYMRMDSLSLSEPYLTKSVDFFREINNQRGLTIAVLGLGKCKRLLGEPNDALPYYQEALDMSNQTGDMQSQMEALSQLGTIHFLNKKFAKAIKNKEESLAISRQINNRAYEINVMDELAGYYGAYGQFENAFRIKEEYTVLSDSIQKEDNLAAISELEIRYQTEKKEQEIVLLEEKAKRNSLEKKGMIGGIIGLLGLFGALFYAMRQRMTKNKLTKAKVDQELAFNIKELDLKKQELTAYALQLAHKNEVLEGIKSNVNEIKVGNDSNRDLQKIVNTIDINQNDDESWEGFRSRFLAVHKDFEVDVKNKFPKVTVNELRLMALLKMQLTSKEIANILNISAEGIKKARYRLRKKLGLESSDSLEDLVLSI